MRRQQLFLSANEHIKDDKCRRWSYLFRSDCARTALSLSCRQGSREGARDVPASLINGPEAGSAAADGALPLAGSPPHGARGARGVMHVLWKTLHPCDRRGRHCGVFASKYSTILDEFRQEIMFSRPTWIFHPVWCSFKRVRWRDGYAERWRSVPTCTEAGRDLLCSVVTWYWWSRFSAVSPPPPVNSGFHNSSDGFLDTLIDTVWRPGRHTSSCPSSTTGWKMSFWWKRKTPKWSFANV